MVLSGTLIYSLIALAISVSGILGALHALLHKKDPSSALVWVAVCLSLPIFGVLGYILFGINRIERHAAKLMVRSREKNGPASISAPIGQDTPSATIYHQTPPLDVSLHLEAIKTDQPHPENIQEMDDLRSICDVPAALLPAPLRTVAEIGYRVTGRALLAGNIVQPLHNGEQTYPKMLEAINNAQKSVWLASYIFDTDKIGKEFITALIAAHTRGVDVRVLVDGLGTATTLPRVDTLLEKQGVPVARFLPPRIIPPQFSINLRNHRKLMAVDGQIAFTGGMNISDAHLILRQPRTAYSWLKPMAALLDKFFSLPTQTDLHFLVKGPVIESLQLIFARDWHFCTGQVLSPAPVTHAAVGNSFCRPIVDGPDDYFDRFHATLLGVISAAKSKICIITPYFLPQRELVNALQSAALRGVEISIILPEESDHRILKWATRNALHPLLNRGISIYYQPPPFAHTKLLLVDNFYVQMGSANLDPRSFSLNFELTMEIFDISLAAELGSYFTGLRNKSRHYTMQDLQKRSLPVRIRDAAFWIFSPYL